MADIAKCLGDGCERKRSCYRFTAEANPLWQSYLSEYNPKECTHYWLDVLAPTEDIDNKKE